MMMGISQNRRSAGRYSMVAAREKRETLAERGSTTLLKRYRTLNPLSRWLLCGAMVGLSFSRSVFNFRMR